MRWLVLIVALATTTCTAIPGSADPSAEVDPPDAVDPQRAALNISCGGPGFPASLLEGPGNAELADEPAAEALRDHLGDPAMAQETDFLPRHGWYEAFRDDRTVLFVARAPAGGVDQPPLVDVGVERDGDGWSVAGWGQCWPSTDVGPGLGLAEFRVAPGHALDVGATQIDVLVTERGCNGGEDARGRIVAPAIIEGVDTVTVVFAVRPRGGVQACPSNPETPFRLTLRAPLGERLLLDGAEVPPRDATTCPRIAACG